MKSILFSICLIIPQLVFADIYMQTDKSGNITYTDTPDANAEKIEISTPNIHETPVTAPTTSSVSNVQPSATTQPDQKKPYQIFGIISPLEDETVRNQPNIMINLTIEPALQKGDKIQIFVDDKPVGSPVETTQIGIGRLDRGIHSVKAILMDANQQILKISPTVTIHVHYGIANKTS